MDNQSTAPSSSSVPAPHAGQQLNNINSLSTELLLLITRHLPIEPDDETRNLRPLCLVSKRFHAAAAQALYEVIDIQTIRRLRLLYTTVKSNPELGRFVRKLFVDLRICWRYVSGSARQILCGYLYEILNGTTNLQLLSLDLRECSRCFRNIGPEDFAADGLNFGFHNFYRRVENRIRNELNVKPESRTFLPKVREFRFSSDEETYKHCAFFALPSLNCIVSLRDTGAWSIILDKAFHTRTQFCNIKKLSLRSSALMTSEVDRIVRVFPNLEIFEVRNNSLFSGGLTGAALALQNLTATLARMRNLKKLALENFPTHLGPANSISSLGGMLHLTELRLGIHHLMCYDDENSQPGAKLLAPSSLPPALKHLQLYTCFSCWERWGARLWRGAGQQPIRPRADLLTFRFILNLSTYVSAGPRLPGLETVCIYFKKAWWPPYSEELQMVRHFEEENGQDWDAGLLKYFCQIPRFEDRMPVIRLSAYGTDELDC